MKSLDDRPGPSCKAFAWLAVLLPFALLAQLSIHELSHFAAAKAFGLRVQGIQFFPKDSDGRLRGFGVTTWQHRFVWLGEKNGVGRYAIEPIWQQVTILAAPQVVALIGVLILALLARKKRPRMLWLALAMAAAIDLVWTADLPAFFRGASGASGDTPEIQSLLRNCRAAPEIFKTAQLVACIVGVTSLVRAIAKPAARRAFSSAAAPSPAPGAFKLDFPQTA